MFIAGDRRRFRGASGARRTVNFSYHVGQLAGQCVFPAFDVLRIRGFAHGVRLRGGAAVFGQNLGQTHEFLGGHFRFADGQSFVDQADEHEVRFEPPKARVGLGGISKDAVENFSHTELATPVRGDRGRRDGRRRVGRRRNVGLRRWVAGGGGRGSFLRGSHHSSSAGS